MNDEQITSTASSDGRHDSHPAFGLVTVVRRSGTPRTLFQSDLNHNHTIALTIHTAERTRRLNTDWVNSRKELIEIEMSEAQWAALVSSIGLGAGTPVTLRRTEARVRIPDIPYEPRIGENLTEVRGAIGRLLASARSTLADLESAFTNKAGVRETREALRRHSLALGGAEANAAFAITTLNEAAESVTQQARADIEAHIARALQVAGTASIEAPDVAMLEIDGGEQDDVR